MAEQNVPIGWHVVLPVTVLVRRSHASGIQPQYPARDELAVEAIGDGVEADGSNHDPNGTDGLIVLKRDDSECPSAQTGDYEPSGFTN
jgi:hypothetical protein